MRYFGMGKPREIFWSIFKKEMPWEFLILGILSWRGGKVGNTKLRENSISKSYYLYLT